MTSNKFLYNAFTDTTFAESSKIAVQAAVVTIFLKIFLLGLAFLRFAMALSIFSSEVLRTTQAVLVGHHHKEEIKLTADKA